MSIFLSGAGFLDMLHDTAKHPRVGCSNLFAPGMRIGVFPNNGGPSLGYLTVEAVLVDKLGRNTRRLKFAEQLPKGAYKGSLLLYESNSGVTK